MSEQIQGSKTWVDYRKSRIGASEAPAILGLSPWETRFGLWLKKTGRLVEKYDPSKPVPYQVAKGNYWEPMVRARYEIINNMPMDPIVLTHPEHNWIMASLDGLSRDRKRVLEIKCAGKDTFSKAKEGIVSDVYWAQLEQQLYVSGAEQVDFYVASIGVRNGKEQILDTALVRYMSVPERRDTLLRNLFEFWREVNEDIPPALTAQDQVSLRRPEARPLFRRIGELERASQTAYEAFESIDKELREVKKEASQFCRAPVSVCEGVKLIKRWVKGAYDLDRIKTELGVDLERYRKPFTEYFDVEMVGR